MADDDDLMSFFDLSKPFKRKTVSIGATGGTIKYGKKLKKQNFDLTSL